jgi:hypothetical protein
MTANIPGSFLTELVGRGIVPHAKVETFIGQRKTGGMPKVGAQDKAGGVVEVNKNPENKEERKWL